jgi:hypothetical protein
MRARTFIESKPFIPGVAPIDTSGWCLACAAIKYGGCRVDDYGVVCPACGEPKVVGRSDADLLRCIDIDIVDTDRDGPPTQESPP